ncbi:MAG TPA: DPP IV N-terminal domain-containing protein, partial [Bacteroidales bacterium]|nr:DPP IV N-terminal domain-containing protein [Bacteroidales bacterium]
MKNKTVFLVTAITIVMFFSTIADINAQYRGRSGGIIGWDDDNHYLERTSDDDGNMVVMSVHVRTGKKKIYDDYINHREEFMQSLPEGFSLGYRSVMSPDNQCVILDKDNDLWIYRLGDEKARKITDDSFEENNPRWSPDGQLIAYTKKRDLFIYDLAAAKEKRLTEGAREKIYNGYASWVYMEEILGRGSRYAAFWWSPDSKKLAYLHTDETEVPEFIINRIDEEDGLHGTQEITPYPKPGDPNPKVKMGVVDIESAKTTWVKTDDSIDQYIAWPDWTPDSKKLMVQVLNRDQDDMRFILADITSGDFKEIYREKKETWVDFFTDNYIMKDGSGFIIRSCASDWMNLYYYDWDGKLLSKITDFDWRVTRILKIDEEKEHVYFSGTGEESTDSHIYRVNLDGTGLIQFSSQHGSHSANISPSGKYVIDSWSSLDNPGSIVAYNKNGKKVRDIFDAGENKAEGNYELVRIDAG